MQATPTEHYKGYTIAASPIETIQRRFLAIFTIYEGRNATYPLAHHHGAGEDDFFTELQATNRAFLLARQWIDAQKISKIR